MNYKKDINGLRTYTITSVLLYHVSFSFICGDFFLGRGIDVDILKGFKDE